MESSPLMLKLASLSMQKAIIFGLLLGAVFYFMLYDDGSSIEAQIVTAKTQLSEERTKYEETQKLIADQESLREQIKTLGENLKIVLSQLPTEINSFRLVRDIQKIARAAGAEIISIKPEKSETTTFYEEIPVEVSLKGKYKDLVTFAYYVSGLERITRIRDLTLTSGSNNNQDTTAEKLDQDEGPTLELRAAVVSFKYIPPAPKTENPNAENEDGGEI